MKANVIYYIHTSVLKPKAQSPMPRYVEPQEKSKGNL